MARRHAAHPSHPARRLGGGRLATVPVMLLAFLVCLTARAGPTAIAEVGEPLGDAVVREVIVHPEFQRVTVTLPDGRALPIEVTVSRPASTPACESDGLAVYPRWELLATEGTTVPLDPAGAASTRALCARLAERAAALDIGLLDRPEPTGAPPQPAAPADPRRSRVHLPTADGFAWRPLHGLLALVLVLGGAALCGPVRRSLPATPWPDLLAVLAVSTLGRLLLSVRGLIIAPDAGYERVEMAWDMVGAHPLYGGGFGALHSPLQRLTGYDPAAIFDLHLALSALAPALLWSVAWTWTRQRAASLGAGLVFGLLPVALKLAGTEVEHVPLATFELLAIAAAVGWRPTGAPTLAWLAAAAAAFAVQLRPEALAFGVLAGLLLLLGAWREHRDRRGRHAVHGLLAALFLAAAGLLRLGELPLAEGTGALAAPSSAPLDLLGALLRPTWQPAAHGRGSHQVFLDLSHTPPLLPVVALWGVAQLRDPRRRGAVLVALAWWALCLLPVLPKAWPQLDAWRLQLAAQAPSVLLVALGLAALPAWRRTATAGVVLSTLPMLGFATQRWAGQVEWQALPGQIARLPPGATVLVPDHEVHAAKQRQVGALLARRAGDPHPDWRPLSSFLVDPRPGPDLFVWENLTCRVAWLPGRGVVNDRTVNTCLQLAERCTLTPFATTALPPDTDVDISLGDSPGEVGLYRIDGCGG